MILTRAHAPGRRAITALFYLGAYVNPPFLKEDGHFGSGIVIAFEDVVQKVGREPVENKNFQFDERIIFGYGEE